jgi:hypothetical protein
MLATDMVGGSKRLSGLTVRLANRYIIRSLKCLIGDAVSPDGVVAFCEGLGVFATPLGVGEFDGRWVIGLVPCVHAFWVGGFL